jgi:hypothetical protein
VVCPDSPGRARSTNRGHTPDECRPAESRSLRDCREPYDLLAKRRREVVGTRLGSRARALDDGAQMLTFATRIAARRVLGRDAHRERAQLRALIHARAEQVANQR